MKLPKAFRKFFFLLPAAFLLGVLLLRLVPGAVWITDNGNKYIQMRNLSETGRLSISHSRPEFFPYGGFHFQKIDETIRSFYPEYLPALTVPFYRLFGERGVVFWPFFCTLALLGSYVVVFGRRAPKWSLLLGTPLLFYSLLFWEMTPSVLAVFGGVALLLRKKYFLGGLVLGCGLWMREELYFVIFSAVPALWFCRERRGALTAAAGFLAGGAPVWLYQYLASGHLLGLHGALYHQNNRSGFSFLSEFLGIFWNYWHNLFRFEVFRGQTPWMWLGAPLLLIAGGASRTFRKWKNFKLASLVIFAVTETILFAGLWFHPSPAFAAGTTVGLLCATPVLAGFFLNWRSLLGSRNRTTRWLTMVGVLYILTVPPLLTRMDVGLIWGARHFLVLTPFFLLLSYRGLALSGMPRWALPTLFCLGVLLQGYGFYALDRVSKASFETEKALHALPTGRIVTDVFFLPEQTPRLFFTGEVLEVASGEAVDRLLNSDIREFDLVLSPRFRRLPDADLKRLLDRFPPAAEPTRHADSGAGFLELLTVRCVKRP